MRLDDLDFELPDDRIARTPADRRDAARLLVAPIRSTECEHRNVADLPGLLAPGDLLVINDTRVVPARFVATRAATGGRIEGLFVETRDDEHWLVMLRSGGRLVEGERVALTDDDAVELIDKQPDGSWLVRKRSTLDTLALLDRVGSMPLPPYIAKARENDGASEQLDALDRKRYQTVYAQAPGAVAAPTAGLHFTDDLLAALESAGVHIARLTLHVGLGTFQPVRTDTLEDHDMHSERFSVPAATLAALVDAKRQNRRIIAVGTTSVRALESLPESLDPTMDYVGETKLLIQPGFDFRYTHGLMTNFHLPRSTLLALVAALVGRDRLLELYATAIEQRYRFYSYGDAMLLLPQARK